jgi:16S rRNA C967 or C1407 C5-methylase (RsmB/RsmF family)
LFDLNYKEVFDYVLLDAPCSSLGTVKKHPEVLINKEKIDDNFKNLQTSMLKKAFSFLKKGGYLIYSVCTFTQLETFEVLSAFNFDKLKKNNNISNINNVFNNIFKDKKADKSKNIINSFSLFKIPQLYNIITFDDFYINTIKFNDIMDTHFIVKIKKM